MRLFTQVSEHDVPWFWAMNGPALSAHLLKIVHFLKLLAFRIQIVLAYQIIVVVVGWHIYELTHDALALGLIGLAEVIPYFACALFAGYAVDHDSRRKFGVLAGTFTSLNALVLVVTTVIAPVARLCGFMLRLLGGVARAFISPLKIRFSHWLCRANNMHARQELAVPSFSSDW